MWTDEQIALAKERLEEISGLKFTHEEMKEAIDVALNPAPPFEWKKEAVEAFHKEWSRTYRLKEHQIRASLTAAVKAQGGASVVFPEEVIKEAFFRGARYSRGIYPSNDSLQEAWDDLWKTYREKKSP